MRTSSTGNASLTFGVIRVMYCAINNWPYSAVPLIRFVRNYQNLEILIMIMNEESVDDLNFLITFMNLNYDRLYCILCKHHYSYNNYCQSCVIVITSVRLLGHFSVFQKDFSL